MKLKTVDDKECSLLGLLGSHVSSLSSFRSFLHKGGDVFVGNYLEEKEKRAPAAQLLFVSYLVELTRPKGHEIGAVGDYFWLQKPWLKKKKDLEGVLAAGSDTAQAASSVQTRRFTPTVSLALQAQTLGGASSSMHGAATAPSSQTTPCPVCMQQQTHSNARAQPTRTRLPPPLGPTGGLETCAMARSTWLRVLHSQMG
ncbi:hypothetical protein Agub_g12997 [Astrephomene gubernaculifera]|uniref:Uncharacterized protein n=1 Tax=Astrephomene gubernaculifera TaxID=47775 RepID=A0AAD3HSA3_9CHLO|nr:hypothetical protein Agub_g12997 [Astrephomene gubernaculifera]